MRPRGRGCYGLVIFDRDVFEHEISLTERATPLGGGGATGVVGFGRAPGDFQVFEDDGDATVDLKDAIKSALINDRRAGPVGPCPSIISV